MRTVYAIQLEVRTDNSETTREAVLDHVARWVTGKYRSSFEFPRTGGELAPVEGHRLAVERLSAQIGTLMSVDLEHPDDRDSSLRWGTTCQIAQTDVIQIVVTVRVGSARFEVVPVRYEFGRPRIVSLLLRDFSCSVNGTPVRIAPRTLAAPFVDDFVQRELLEKGRSLPVFVLSRSLHGDLAIDPVRLNDWIMGHAAVVVLEDRWAAYRLTHAVGKGLSCFDGYGRLYWPGTEVGSDPRRSPRFTPGTLQGVDRIGRDFPRQLFEQLAAVASVRLVEGDTIRAVRKAAEHERLSHIEAMRRDRESSRDYEEFLALADQEIRELRESNERLEVQNADLRARLDTAQANLEAVWRDQGGSEHVGAELEDEGPTSEAFSSVREALDEGGRRFGDFICVYPDACDSASKSGFARPAEVFEALEAIADLARARGQGNTGPWEAWFEQRGFKYSPTESEQTRNRFGASRKFRTGDGSRRTIYRHLTLGGGDRVNCLQIYFEPQDEGSCIDIGYCGVHLPYAKQST